MNIKNETNQNQSTEDRTENETTYDTKMRQHSTRSIDPNVLQRKASNPESSIWVSASAGSGKTKVLTDRVLRLLLPRNYATPGTPAHKILCLTFTKAAASEMALRITKTLSKWSILPEYPQDENTKINKDGKLNTGKSLFAVLKDLLGRAPEDFEIKAARKLFTQVIDNPHGGLQMMTIHAFCQSILSRFPLESGLSPGFEVIEEGDAKDLLTQSQNIILGQAQSGSHPDLQDALSNLVIQMNEDQLYQMIKECLKERGQFGKLLTNIGGIEALPEALRRFYQIDAKTSTEQSLIANACTLSLPHETALRETAKIMLENTASKTDQSRAEIILGWLESTTEKRVQLYDDYTKSFIKSGGLEPYKNIATAKLQKSHPQITEILGYEAMRLLEIKEQEKAIACAALTANLFTLTNAVLEHYQNAKRKRASLDFEDLIQKTSELLQGATNTDTAPDHSMRSWVMYKLDQGLDHILVDEAQDTNPEQWQIIQALCDEFFSGQSAREEMIRTKFVVGDEKQSIYSFQRASPEEFQKMQRFFKDKVEQAEQHWDKVDMSVSFRSTKSVLQLVDMVFSQEFLKNDPGFEDISHSAFRTGQAGTAELWPIFEDQDQDEKTSVPWEPPVKVIETESGSQLCAEYIADKIENWIKRSEILESKNRPIKPEDILILVRSRNSFVEQVSRALKQRDIPVSGQDRMVLNDQIVVQDMLAMAEFCLFPEDDLTLATLLKSPLIGIDEDTLFELCLNRNDTLWSIIKNAKTDSPASQIGAYLSDQISKSKALRPFEFFSQILNRACPADERSGLRAFQKRMGEIVIDPLEELLNTAIDFERLHIPSLQLYVQFQKKQKIEIKRQMENTKGAVKIMTVHGSKGLQAPIVILPDTMRSARHVPGQTDKKLLWPQKTGLDIPLFSPRKNLNTKIFSKYNNNLDSRHDQEYRRLLYVALTRAEDRIYITGHHGSKTPLTESWYFDVRSAMENHPDVETIEETLKTNPSTKTEHAAETDHISENENATYNILKLSNPQIHDVTDSTPKTAQGLKTQTPEPSNLPQWLLKPAPKEAGEQKPINPSQLSEQQDPATLSPLENNQYRFKRGNITHKLLQILPEIQTEERLRSAQNFVERFAKDLSENIRADICRETLKILNHPAYQALFGPESMAEVPINGYVNGKLFSAQIDRLLIKDNEISVIDYKTNRPPPQNEADIPLVYKRQMQSYREILQEIYKGHTIKTYLLWTDGTRLMEIS